MATSSGSASTRIQESASEQDLTGVRKRKRMISNRESARRSRMRKQKHLDDLTAEMIRLRETNGQIFASLRLATDQMMRIEGENSVLTAQVCELSRRLESLNGIIGFIEGNFGNSFGEIADVAFDGVIDNSWSYVYLNQPIMASADTPVGFL